MCARVCEREGGREGGNEFSIIVLNTGLLNPSKDWSTSWPSHLGGKGEKQPLSIFSQITDRAVPELRNQLSRCDRGRRPGTGRYHSFFAPRLKHLMRLVIPGTE